MAKNIEENPNNFNIIGNGTKIIGDIEAFGDLRIDGILEGNFVSNAKFVLGNTGKVIGEIKCKNAEIFGEIKGKIEVAEILMLCPTSQIYGDIFTKKLAIEPGAVFIGNCKMLVESN
ncbi:MAG: polymer-forming cytoskeletal protein [Bacteroidales bacterium]|jgi:cytoskeletal protein CcmA (bactofilin family)|nr:polymer-forming cytoskeletal protein [Bacteroidales bacterium]